ncbi:trans-aconitate 2-methyltransferase [Methylomonas sp. ZR1]|uniref:class I SAM-dependent methyltransferase n=1 Tax=unclassified Methylomonas TaxID=2608980 RepID=UPI001492760C|nr:class I SAM-dependent methyltransferase [Methylomonas sp. ZR1]NOV30120.1 class I SAM-dependent methyltransferase [Methylomonas sp. ZR1]
MRHCLACNSQYDTKNSNCLSCGFSPCNIDGFDSYAPDYARGGGGFKASYFSELACLESSNFWFQSRNKIILWALKKYSPSLRDFLEIGCGTGFVLSAIQNSFPDVAVNGSEIFVEGLGFAAKRVPSANLMQMDARQIPFMDEFDAIGAFDVLEHIKEDELVLSQIRKALKSKGVLLLTVPQHAWLWSVADEYALHERRYSAIEIYKKVEMAGFRIVRSTSFVSLILPAMIFSRFFKKNMDEKFDPTSELKIDPWLNILFASLLRIELAGIKFGMNYPLGGSRLIVATKI